MKRNFKLTLALLVVSALIMAVSFEACKKEILNPTPINNSGGEVIEEPVIHDAKFVVNQIKTFKKQMEAVQMNNGQKDNEYMPVDSAIWNMGALFNATYGFPDELYKEKALQDLTFSIAVNSENKVSLSDVTALYNQIKESVRQVYANDGFTTDKALMSVVMSLGDNNGSRQIIDVKVISGRTAYNIPEIGHIIIGPFSQDDCWYFGEYGGTCYDSTIVYDAAEIIEDSVNFYYGWKLPINPNYRNIYVSQTMVYLEGDEYYDNANNDYYVYYKPNYTNEQLYIHGSDLNKYYNNEVKIVTEFVLSDPRYSNQLPENPVFIELNLQGQKNSNLAQHINYITYGSKYLIRIDELGEPKDLLKQ